MKKRTSALLLVLLTASVTAGAGAQTGRGNLASAPTIATIVCRPAKSGETATATTTARTALVCKPLDLKPIMEVKPAIMAMPDGAEMFRDLLSSFNFEYGR